MRPSQPVARAAASANPAPESNRINEQFSERLAGKPPVRRYSKTRKARIGFIGAGWWSTTYYMPLLHKRPDVDLVTVCGLDEAVLERCQGDFGFAHVTTDYRELLRQKLDGVIVGSPHALHAEQGLAALKAGCHVMVEKPLATSSKAARQLVALAKKKGLHVVVPCGWQYRPIGIEAKKLMAKRVTGDIEFVACHMASGLKNLLSGKAFEFDHAYVPANLSTWADPRFSHGGYGYGQLPHGIGLMLWITGLKPKTAFARMTKPGSRVDMYDAISVGYEGGAIGTISGAGTLPLGTPGLFQLDIRIFGKKGMLHLDVARNHLSWHSHNGRHETIPLGPQDSAYLCDGPPHQFVDLILGLTKQNNSPGEVAMQAVGILDASYLSHRSGRNEKI
jgi:predicted dehydrogenase